MGWGNGTGRDGRPIGYNVNAKCDHPECNEQIDRGLAYACGGMHGEDSHSCDNYFCEAHLNHMIEVHDDTIRICQACYNILRPYLDEDDVLHDEPVEHDEDEEEDE